tara:strand:- start:49 stop:822 length:774 start_codon:yes stop_codon:yes gene_type:complete
MTADSEKKPATKKVTDTDGSEWFEATDGSRYKTRAGAYKKSKKLETEKDPPEQVDTRKSAEPEDPGEGAGTEDPEWANFEWLEDDGPVEFIPGMLKKVRPNRSSRGAPTKKQLEAEKQMNMAILKVGYRTADYGLTRWKRGVLQDPEAKAIKHTEEDYDWIADVTEEALADQGLNIGAAVGPGAFALGANAIWFGSPIMQVRSEAKKLGLVSKASIGFGKILERIPFLGKSIKQRRMRKEQEAIARAFQVKEENTDG